MGGAELVRRILVVTDPDLMRTVRQVTPSFLANSPAVIIICTDLHRADRELGPRARPLDLEPAVEQVLEDARPREASLVGHVAALQHRDIASPCDAHHLAGDGEAGTGDAVTPPAVFWLGWFFSAGASS